MRRLGGLLALFILIAVLSGGPFTALASSAPSPPPAGWAVLIENNSYGGRYTNLPVGYINSTRMLTVLMHRGWPSDHVLLVRDNLDPDLLKRTMDWLAARVHADDTALLYIAGEYEFFARDLRWGAVLPVLWRQIPTSRRVLIVESCYAERLAAAAHEISGLALPAVGSDELDLWGLPGARAIIQGGAFTYYLSRALGEQPQDTPLAFEPAFARAVADAQKYFREVVSQTPVVLDPFHAMGAYPERLPYFPNPHLVGRRDRAHLQTSDVASSP